MNMQIVLNNKEMDSLLYLTDGKNVVKVNEFLPYYKEFLSEELREIAIECDTIEFQRRC